MTADEREREQIREAVSGLREVEHEVRAIVDVLEDAQAELATLQIEPWATKIRTRAAALRRLAVRLHDHRREIASVVLVDDESEDTNPRMPILE